MHMEEDGCSGDSSCDGFGPQGGCQAWWQAARDWSSDQIQQIAEKGAKLSGLFNQKMLKPILDEQGQRKMEEVEQWELVTSHVARSTLSHLPGGGGGHQDGHEHDRAQG